MLCAWAIFMGFFAFIVLDVDTHGSLIAAATADAFNLGMVVSELILVALGAGLFGCGLLATRSPVAARRTMRATAWLATGFGVGATIVFIGGLWLETADALKTGLAAFFAVVVLALGILCIKGVERWVLNVIARVREA
jgi:hypothetical protein